jgi:hypothetical protein
VETEHLFVEGNYGIEHSGMKSNGDMIDSVHNARCHRDNTTVLHPRQEPRGVVALDERMDYITERSYRRTHQPATGDLPNNGFGYHPGAVAHRLVKSVFGVFDPERNVTNSVAMRCYECSNVTIRLDRAGQDESHVTTAGEVRRTVTHSGFESSVANGLEAERRGVKVRRLARIANVELDMIETNDP